MAHYKILKENIMTVKFFGKSISDKLVYKFDKMEKKFSLSCKYMFIVIIEFYKLAHSKSRNIVLSIQSCVKTPHMLLWSMILHMNHQSIVFTLSMLPYLFVNC